MPTNDASNEAAEEILRMIYGEDLRGCAVSPDSIAAVIRTALKENSNDVRDVAELHVKAFQAVELLATPPGDGSALSPEDLRSLLGDRLDQIRALATKVLAATNSTAAHADDDERPESTTPRF